MKIQHLVFLSLLSAADASFTVAAETTDSDQAYALGAREEELMASLDPSELSALLGGKSLAVPHDPAEGLLFYPAEACRLVESQELDDVSKVASAHLFGPSGCGVRPFAGKLLRFSSARSALVRIELRDARGSGSIALWRAGAARPTVGLLDYGPGQSVISTAIVPVCAEVGLDPCSAGEISFAIEGDPVAVTIDLLGYFAPQQKVPTPVAAVAEGGDPVSLSARSLVSPFWEAGVDAGSIHYSDGYVGIGTALPTAPLEVWGLTTSYPNAKAARFIVRGESSTFRDQIAVTSESSAASSTGYGIAFAGSGHHRGGIYARDLGGSASAKGELNLWARSSGNIVLTAGATGINVADPTATLHVGGDLKLNLGEGLLFNHNTSYWGSGYDARLLQILDTNGAKGNADGGLVVESRTTSDDNRRPILTLRHDAGYPKVGIGSVYPAGLLEIHSRRQTGAGTISTLGPTVIGTGTAFTSQLNIGSEILVGTQTRRVAAIESDTSLTLNSAFLTDVAGVAFTYQLPALLMNGEGRLGLGTGAQPLTEKLEVVGNLKLTGNLLAGGDLCIGACP